MMWPIRYSALGIFTHVTNGALWPLRIGRTLFLDGVLREGSQPLLYGRAQLLLCSEQGGVHVYGFGFPTHWCNVMGREGWMDQDVRSWPDM